MKRNRTLLMLVMALMALPTMALDFTYTYEGQTLNYTVLDEEAKTCMVATNREISGNLIIPSQAGGYSVKSIGNSAFIGCHSLISIVIPNSVTSIENYAFAGCGMPSIEIPNSVKSIGNEAFQGCNNLTSINIPGTVISIGPNSFGSCENLTDINVDPSNPNYTSADGLLFNHDKTTLLQCPAGKKSCNIPNSVTSIGYKAFGGCTNLTSIEIPNSVKSIGEYAFSFCINLTSIKISNSVKSIGEYAFNHCSNLTTIEIPNSVTSIGKLAFYYCSSLTSVEISSSVSEIGTQVFMLCGNLTSINVSPSNQNYASQDGILFNHDKTTMIICPAGKTTCNIPNSVTTIGRLAFEYCTKLTSIVIPNSVTSIGDFAFSYCNSLNSVVIPSYITSIANSAFSGTRSLTSVYYNTDNPITGSSDIFRSCPEEAILYVPEAAVEKCRQIDPWKQFKNIQAYNFTSGVEAIGADFNANLPVEVYNLNGVKIASTLDDLTPGVYIVRQGDAVKKIAVK